MIVGFLMKIANFLKKMGENRRNIDIWDVLKVTIINGATSFGLLLSLNA
jgi:hypothetical protein